KFGVDGDEGMPAQSLASRCKLVRRGDQIHAGSRYRSRFEIAKIHVKSHVKNRQTRCPRAYQKTCPMPYPPRTRGMKMNGHGEGRGPIGTSISVGPSRRANACRRTVRSSSGVRARSPAAPKLSAKRTKSGLARS